MRFSAPAREVGRLTGGAPGVELAGALAEHAAGRIGARTGAAPCEAVSEPRPLPARAGWVRCELRLRCPGAPATALRVATFFERVPDHVHLAQIRIEGRRTLEHLFRGVSQELEIPGETRDESPSGEGLLLAWLGLGVRHVASGLDHLAFLLALLLGCRRLRELAWVATGFSAGHTLTLTLAALDRLRPEAPLVEATIGYSIALVALEVGGARAGLGPLLGRWLGAGLGAAAGVAALRSAPDLALTLAGLALFGAFYLQLAGDPARARRMRPGLALGFGLVHGFGFAGPLLAVGLPAERLVVALLGFNLGVEIGQLAVLGLGWGVLVAARARWPELGRGLALDLGAAGLCGLGMYWFVERATAA